MNLTGKCKIDFEKWFEDIYDNNNDVIMLKAEFDLIPFEFKYGVYVDFFDGFNFIDIDEIYNGEYYLIAINYKNEINHRLEGRIEAIKTANEIYNLK